MNYTIKISQYAEEIAAELLKVKAVKLNPQKPFVWSSGWNSPIYCDNRITLSYPQLRSRIKQHLAEVVKENFKEVTAIAGVATAGIPQGALVADMLNVPYIYVRSKPKEHGMSNLIEGYLQPDSKVVLIEDLISTGGSSLKAAEAIRHAGGKVLAIAAIFTYGFPHAEKSFKEAGVSGIALSDYNTLIELAAEKDIVNKDDIRLLQLWRENPSEWKPA